MLVTEQAAGIVEVDSQMGISGSGPCWHGLLAHMAEASPSGANHGARGLVDDCRRLWPAARGRLRSFCGLFAFYGCFSCGGRPYQRSDAREPKIASDASSVLEGTAESRGGVR